MRLINFLKKYLNFIFLGIIFVLVFFLFTSRENIGSYNRFGDYDMPMGVTTGLSMPSKRTMKIDNMGSAYQESTPVPEMDIPRMVTTDTNISLIVDNVESMINKISDYAINQKGFVVSKNYSDPEVSPTGNIQIRVPSDNLDKTLEFLKSNAIKVANLDIYGQDITDDYYDSQERLRVLNKNKQKMEKIMDSASTVDQMLKVQKQLFSIQDQIDRIVGQLDSMKKRSQTSLVSIQLSTDELSLPYAPKDNFRPALTYKYAVRSLLGTLRTIVNAGIWLGVYAVLIVPFGIIIWLFYKKNKRS